MKYFILALCLLILSCEPEEKKAEKPDELPYTDIPFHRQVKAISVTKGGKLLFCADNDSVYFLGANSLTKSQYLFIESVEEVSGNSSQLFILSSGGSLIQVDTLFKVTELSFGGGSTINNYALSCNEDSVFLSLSVVNYSGSRFSTSVNQYKTFKLSGLNFNQDATSISDSRLTNTTFLALISAKVGSSSGFYFGWRDLNTNKYRFTLIPENVKKFEILANKSVLTDKYLIDSLGYATYTWTFSGETLVRFSQSSSNNLYAITQTSSELKFRSVKISNLGTLSGDLLLTLPKSVWKFVTISKNILVVQNTQTKSLRTYTFGE